ncbi:MAG: CPXCG motif-containing cysteine-rich protein [Flavobacteriaceae bacterium]
MIEQMAQCPYCWQNISIWMDPDSQTGSLVEDCEVCCQPIEVHYTQVEKEYILELIPLNT